MKARLLVLSLSFAIPDSMQAEAPPAAPRAVVEPAPQDLGTLAQGEDVVSTISVRNDGNAPLTLGKLTPPAELSIVEAPTEVAPGASGKILVKVDTWRVAGKTTLSLTAATNDPEQATLTIPVTVNVRPFIAATPGYARYIVVQGAPEGTIGQTLWDPEDGDFAVVEALSPYPHLRVTARDARPNERQLGLTARQWRIESTLDSMAPVGPLAAFIVVKTDHPRQKEVRIPVSGFVRPLLAVTPPEADLGAVDPRKPARRSLHVKSFAEEAVAIVRASCDVPGIEASVEPIEEGRSYSLKLATTAAVQEGDFSGRVRLQTDSPKKPYLDVPIKGHVLPAPRD
jgi:hypothetical protein